MFEEEEDYEYKRNGIEFLRLSVTRKRMPRFLAAFDSD
jgi:hypothetical protein